MSTIIRKDIRAVKVGDRFRWYFEQVEREVVRVRAIKIPVCRADGVTVDQVHGVEILHASPHRPGVDYLEIPDGSQLAVLIP